MRRMSIVAGTLTIAVLVAGAVSASAASLGTVSSGLFSANGSVTYSPASRSVSDLTLTTSGSPATVSALTATITGSSLANLAGQTITVALLNSSGAQVQSVSATLSTSTNLTVGTTTATATLAVSGAPLASSFASWAVFVAGVQALGPAAGSTLHTVAVGHGAISAVTPPVDWKGDVIPSSGVNAATSIGAITVSDVSGSSACLTITITGTTSTPTAWGFKVDYSKPPFYGTAPSVDSHAIIANDSGTVLTLKGTSNRSGTWQEFSNNSLLTTSRTLDILVCAYSGVTPADEPAAYSVSAQVHGSTWTNTQACVDRTITGNGLYPFNFGWSTSFDMTDAIALLKAHDAGAPRAFAYEANPRTPANYTAGTSMYSMIDYWGNSISGTNSVVAELCVVEF
jgi:hypothetical protein